MTEPGTPERLTPDQGTPASTILADRACIGCGFNLYGQTVTKESHYGLAVARCPECGTVAALQSYPVMTHWVNRFRALLSALFLILLVAVFAANTASHTGMTRTTIESASENLSRAIAEAYGGATQTQSTPQTITTSSGSVVINRTVSRWVTLDQAWIDNKLDDAVEEAGGVAALTNPDHAVLYIPITLMSFVFGAFWSLALLNQPRWRAAAWSAAVVLFAGAIFYTVTLNLTPETPRDFAADLLTNTIAPRVIGTQLVVTIQGVVLARAIARRVIVFAIPPRARVPFSVLWTSEDKPLPKPGR